MENKDEEIKNILRENYDIEVPVIISKGVDDILLEIKDNRIKRKSINKYLIIAASFIFAILIINMEFPSLANEIPVLKFILGNNSIFNITNWKEENEGFENLAEAKNYTIEVNQTINNVTVQEFGCDGIAFYIIYDIDNPKYDNYSYNSTVEIGGEKYLPGVIIPKTLDENLLQITQVFPIGKGLVIDNNEVAQISINNGEKNLANFSISISKEILDVRAKQFNVNKKINKEGFKGKIVSISQSLAYVSLISTYNNSDYNTEQYTVTIEDAMGKNLEEVDLGRMEKGAQKTTRNSIFKAFEGTKISKIYIIKHLLPYMDFNDITNKIRIDLESDCGKEITFNDEQSVTLLEVNNEEDELEIEFDTKGIQMEPYWFSGGITLYNKKLDKYLGIRPFRTEEGYYKFSILKELEFYDDDLVFEFGDPKEVYKVIDEIKLDN